MRSFHDEQYKYLNIPTNLTLYVSTQPHTGIPPILRNNVSTMCDTS